MLDVKKLIEDINNNTNASFAVFIRHGEKQSQFGGLLSINGSLTTEEIAKQLKFIEQPMFIFTSSEPRCLETSKIIAFTTGISQAIELKELGNPGIHILNNHEYLTLYSKYRARDIYHLWKKGHYQSALKSPIQLKNLALKFLNVHCQRKGVHLFISQSGTIASLGYALGKVIYDIDQDEWVDYLNGFWLPVSLG